MINIRDGILKISLSRDFIGILWDFSFLMVMISITTLGDIVEHSNLIYYISFFTFFAVSLLNYARNNYIKKTITVSIHFIWYAAFILLALFSIIWAQNTSNVLVPIQRMLQNLIIAFGIIDNVSSKRDFKRVLNIFLASCTFMCIFILVNTPITSWTKGFIGISTTGYNSNDVGFVAAMGVTVAFFMGFVVMESKFYYLISALCMAIVFFSSSRKAMLISIAGALLLTLFSRRGKNISLIKLFIALVLVVLVLVAIFKIPALYNIIGVRFETMIRFFNEDQSADSSLDKRMYLIEMAKKFFTESPILGLGFNNFSVELAKYGGFVSYAHNNYSQVAADLGIVGIITYYWFYAYLFVKLFLQIRKNQPYAVLAFTLIILLLIFEYGIVNYYKTNAQTILAIVYSCVCFNDYEFTRKKYLDQMRRQQSEF